jgi:hypothetical protein
MSNATTPLPAAFGSWQFQQTSDTAGLSFDIAPGDEIPVWRSELPADPEVAAAQLTENEAQTQDSITALNAVPDRIDALVQQAQQATAGGISFDTGAVEALPEPEAELLDMVQTINRPTTGVSFALGGEDQSKIEAAFAQFGDDMQGLLRLVTHFAWVDTEVEGELLGRSVVSWSGDLDTNWGRGLKVESYQLHKRALVQAFATRNIALHAITITAQTAIKLSVLLATPASAILALPLAWKFVKQIMADVQKYKEITEVPS